MPVLRKYDKIFIILREELSGYAIEGRKPGGNCSIEIRENRGKATIYVQGLRQLKNPQIYKAYLIAADNINAIGVPVGLLQIDGKGKCAKVWEFDPDNVGGSGLKIEQFNIVAVMVKSVTYNTKEMIVALCGHKNDEILWKHIFKEFNIDESIRPQYKGDIDQVRTPLNDTISEISQEVALDTKTKSNDVDIASLQCDPVCKDVQSEITQTNTCNSSFDNIQPIFKQDDYAVISDKSAFSPLDITPEPIQIVLPPINSVPGPIQPILPSKGVAIQFEMPVDFSDTSDEKVEESLVKEPNSCDLKDSFPTTDECPIENSTTKGCSDSSELFENFDSQKALPEKDEIAFSSSKEEEKLQSNHSYEKVKDLDKATEGDYGKGVNEIEDKELAPHLRFAAVVNKFFEEYKELNYYNLISHEEEYSAKTKTEIMSVDNITDISYMFGNNTEMTPFTGQMPNVKWIRISMDELVLLDINVWNYINDIFLLYAYKKYKHLILGCCIEENNEKNKTRYLLGIPGIYDSSLKLCASKLGFTQFRCCENKNSLEGDAGYWLMELYQ